MGFNLAFEGLMDKHGDDDGHHLQVGASWLLSSLCRVFDLRVV